VACGTFGTVFAVNIIKEFPQGADMFIEGFLDAFYTNTGGAKLRKYELYPTHHDFFEYYGNTEIVRIRKQNGTTIREDWLNFDSVEEAMEYFNTECGEFTGYYH
jgi:hypothetical protein